MADSMSEQSSLASDQSQEELSINEDAIDEQSPSPPKRSRVRPSRHRTVPAKFREAALDVRLEEINLDMTRSVVVKCSQTGKLHHVKLKDLSREDCEPLTKDDLVKGSELMADMKGKIYPIQFVQFKDKDKANMSNSQKSADKSKMRSNENLEKATPTRKEKSHGSNVRKRGPESDKDESGGLRDKTNVSEILARAKNPCTVKPPSKKQKPDHVEKDDDVVVPSAALDDADKDLLVNLAHKIEKMERMMVKMMEILRSGTIEAGGGTVVKKEDEECMVNGVNVMRIPSRDAYSFALQLLTILFSKEELSASLLFKSKKSEKPALDQGRVEKMLKIIEKRYGNDWDLKTLTQKVNQKCRDSAKD